MASNHFSPIESATQNVKLLEELAEDKLTVEESELNGAAASDERSSAEAEKLRKTLAEIEAKLEAEALKHQVSIGCDNNGSRRFY